MVFSYQNAMPEPLAVTDMWPTETWTQAAVKRFHSRHSQRVGPFNRAVESTELVGAGICRLSRIPPREIREVNVEQRPHGGATVLSSVFERAVPPSR
jgi:hypothetical protein